MLKFEALEHLLEFTGALLAEAARDGRQLLLCGDFNVAHTALDIRNAKGNEKNSGFLPSEREWFSRLLAQGWVDVVRAKNPDVPNLYSWWSQRIGVREKKPRRPPLPIRRRAFSAGNAPQSRSAKSARRGSRSRRCSRPRAGVGGVPARG